MKGRKEHKGIWIQCISVVLAVLCMFGVNQIPAKAATTTDECVDIVAIYDANGEAVDAGTAIVMNLAGSFNVFTMPFDGDMSGADARLLTGTGNTYELSYMDEATAGGKNLYLWELDPSGEGYENASGDAAFLKLEDPHQNETALAVFFEVGTNDIATSAMTLLECSDSGMLTADQYPSNARYPAALVNGNGNLVGICLDEGVVWAIRNGAEFYSNTSSAEPDDTPTDPEVPGTKAPPLPEREDRTTGETQESSSASSAADSEKTDGPKPGPSVFGILPVAAGIFIIIAAAAVILILAGKKKKQGSVPPKKQEDSPKLWLAARGGCMNGRVYPVGNQEITIGRDASSVIRYPGDTAGVSRVHAKIYWQGGQLMLMDCNSTSGTFLQRQGKLQPMVPVAIGSGDIFYIGEKINSFEIRE